MKAQEMARVAIAKSIKTNKKSNGNGANLGFEAKHTILAEDGEHPKDRDYLLPKLISGGIRISEVEKRAGGV